MEFQELIARLALALGIGLLIGLERGWRTRGDTPGSRAAGIRTFAISGLLGAVIGAIGQALGGVGGGIAVGIAFAAFAAAMAVFCLEENRADQQFSATTWVAAMLTFALGAYALFGDMRAAAALAVAAAIILALREPIHGWVERITWPELRSGLVLLAMTFVALPIIPDEPVGPFGGVNLREVWLIAILLAAVSFAGYAAVKYFGARRGVLLAGVAGGLASSTAVTVSSARRAAAGESTPHLLAAGVSLASAVMFLRVGVIVAAINTDLLVLIAPPLAAAAAVAAGFALFAVFLRPPKSDGGKEVAFRNPFGFWSVVGFAAFLGIVIVLGRALGEGLGAAGAIAGALAIGLADVDSVTVAMARLAPQPLGPQEAALAILAATVSNTAVKIVVGAAIGRGRFAIEIAAMAIGCIAAGGLVFWAVSLIAA
ncbi:MAG: MgtC/SapB family protein [Alphaproteobacteria bacterium]|nr:MgtC/SapB family protein [Alphaproteobacteria bacterium]